MAFKDRVRIRASKNSDADDVEKPERRGVRASAQRVNLRSRKSLQRQAAHHQDWQDEAWDYFDDIGEIKYPVRLAGNVMAKLRFYIAVRPLDQPEGDPLAATDPESGIPPALALRAEAELQRLRSPYGGRAEIVRMLYMNLEVAGEAYLVCRGPRPEVDDATGDEIVVEESWEIRSVDEISVTGDKVFVLKFPGDKGEQLDPEKGDDVIRIWTRHPRFSDLPDNAMRGVLGVAETVTLLENQVKADAKSHMNAGLVLFPNSMEQLQKERNPPTGDGNDEERGPSFLEQVDETFTEPVENPSSAAAVAPMPVLGTIEELNAIRHVSFVRTSDAGLDARIEGRVLRMARGLNYPVETVLGHQQTCVDTDTEVLTRQGWKRHDEVRVGDEALTLNHETGLAEWQEITAVSLFPPDGRDLVLMHRKSFSSLTTLDHRWPVLVGTKRQRGWRESKDLNQYCRVVTAAQPAVVPEAKWSDDFVELVAWDYTEGHRDRRSRRDGGAMTIITQSHGASPQHVERIRAVCTRLLGEPLSTLHRTSPSWRAPNRPYVRAWTERKDKDDRNARFVLSALATADLEAVAPDRVPTFEFLLSLTPAQLDLFLHVSVLADGWVVNSGTRMFSQTDPRRVDAYEFAAVLSGRTPSRWTRHDRGHVQHYCSITDRTWVEPCSGRQPKQFVQHPGDVWCPTVAANGNWLARRSGKVHFTGNTFANAAQIDEDKFKEHYEPGAITICDAWTVGVVQQNLIDDGEDPDLVMRMFVWYDPGAMLRGVEPHETADRGWDIGAISDEAWRRVNGWTEDDQPDPIEKMLRVAMFRVRSLDPGLSTAILELLGVPLDIPAAVPAGPQPVDPNIPPEPDDGDNPTPPTQSVTPRGPAVLGAGMPSLEQALLLWVLAKQAGTDPGADVENVVRAAATPQAIRDTNRAMRGERAGRKFMEIDRELRTRISGAAHVALQRAIDKAGNRLKATAPSMFAKRRGAAQSVKGERELLAKVNPRYAVATLGPARLAELGFTEDGLIGGDAFAALGEQFRMWVADAQERALALAGRIVTIDSAKRRFLADQQARDLDAAWEWFADELTALTVKRLYAPDLPPPTSGEFDPSSSVPMGLIRQAVARAGGASRLQPLTPRVKAAGGPNSADTWVVVNNGDPLGGIGTGELIDTALSEGGAANEGYVWDYGPAIRKSPFEDHEVLDGQEFSSWDDPALDASSSWVDSPYLFPGDHDGCACDVVPVIFGEGDIAFNEATGEGFYTGDGTSPPTDVEVISEEEAQRRAIEREAEGATAAPPSATFDSLVDALRTEYPDVAIEAVDHGTHVSVDKIVVPADARSEGTGSAIMNAIIADADRRGLPITLTPSTDFGGTKAGLDRFYGRLGFVKNTGRNALYESTDALVRYPGGKR